MKIKTGQAPDTIVLLQDVKEGTTLCVASSRLAGFSLGYDNLQFEEKEYQLTLAQQGDYQTDYNLNTMNNIQADLYIFAGDFNVTRDHYPQRLKMLEEDKYMTDLSDVEPTLYDANLKEEDKLMPQTVKLDYIYARGNNGLKVEKEILGNTPLEKLERPSDHLPVAAKITMNLSQK